MLYDNLLYISIICHNKLTNISYQIFKEKKRGKNQKYIFNEYTKKIGDFLSKITNNTILMIIYEENENSYNKICNNILTNYATKI